MIQNILNEIIECFNLQIDYVDIQNALIFYCVAQLFMLIGYAVGRYKV